MFAGVCLAVMAVQLWQLYPLLRQLTLRTAWYWAVAALAATLLLAVMEGLSLLSAPLRAACSFLCSTLWLTPAMAVLGARRPGANAWPWFVVLPMVLVLQWPSLSQLLNSHGRAPIELGIPAGVGVAAVMLMSFGNYFGTRQTLAAALAAAGVCLLLLPVTRWPLPDWPWPALATLPLALAAWLAVRRLRWLHSVPFSTAQQAADRLWVMFRDSYGIVWAARVQDRVNQFAVRERWSVTLTLDGFVPSRCAPAGSPPPAAIPPGDSPPLVPMTDQELQRPLHILVWILRRFAEPEWLQQQLGRYHPAAPAEADSAVP